MPCCSLHQRSPPPAGPGGLAGRQGSVPPRLPSKRLPARRHPAARSPRLQRNPVPPRSPTTTCTRARPPPAIQYSTVHAHPHHSAPFFSAPPAATQTSFDSAQDVLHAKDRKLAQMQTQLATQAAALGAVEQQVKGERARGSGSGSGSGRGAFVVGSCVYGGGRGRGVWCLYLLGWLGGGERGVW